MSKPRAISEVLKSLQESTFSLPLPGENLPKATTVRRIDEFELEIDDIDFSLENFANGVPTILVKRTGQALVDPFCILWMESLDCGMVPQK